jgi:hypothetical protein
MFYFCRARPLLKHELQQVGSFQLANACSYLTKRTHCLYATAPRAGSYLHKGNEIFFSLFQLKVANLSGPPLQSDLRLSWPEARLGMPVGEGCRQFCRLAMMLISDPCPHPGAQGVPRCPVEQGKLDGLGRLTAIVCIELDIPSFSSLAICRRARDSFAVALQPSQQS